MIDRLEAIKKRYEELTTQLSSEEVLSDYNTLMKLSKEQKKLEETYNKYIEYLNTSRNIEEAKELLNDPELGEMAHLELEEATQKKEKITHFFTLFFRNLKEIKKYIFLYSFMFYTHNLTF